MVPYRSRAERISTLKHIIFSTWLLLLCKAQLSWVESSWVGLGSVRQDDDRSTDGCLKLNDAWHHRATIAPWISEKLFPFFHHHHNFFDPHRLGLTSWWSANKANLISKCFLRNRSDYALISYAIRAEILIDANLNINAHTPSNAVKCTLMFTWPLKCPWHEIKQPAWHLCHQIKWTFLCLISNIRCFPCPLPWLLIARLVSLSLWTNELKHDRSEKKTKNMRPGLQTRASTHLLMSSHSLRLSQKLNGAEP